MAAPDADELTSRKDNLTTRLQLREEKRQLDLQKKRDETVWKSDAKVSSALFAEANERIRTAIAAASDTDSFKRIAADIQDFQKSLNDSVMTLSSYDIRKTQDTISSLREQFQIQYSNAQPKKKFAFKAKRKQPEAERMEAAAGDSQTPSAFSSISAPFESNNISNISDVTVEKRGDDVNRKDLVVSTLSGCTVRLYGAPSAVHVADLKDCTILLGPVASSVFVDDCRNCTFVVACHQLRIHCTVESKFYIHVTSKAIIEDSSDLAFAPYAWNYPGQSEDFETSSLSKTTNNWDQIDDFNWLASEQKSPNWRILDESERLTF